MWVTHINRTCNGISPAPWGPGEGSKVQISFNFNYKVNFRDFYTKLCVCSHKWKIQNESDGIFILSPGSCPSGGTLGRWGCPGGQKNSNMAKVHIKSTGLTSRTECKENFHPRVKLVTLEWGQKVKYHWISVTMSISKIFYTKLFVCFHK